MMRLKRSETPWRTPDESEWHRVFAWRPVRVAGQWAWLEMVERRFTANGLDWSTHFRQIPAPILEGSVPRTSLVIPMPGGAKPPPSPATSEHKTTALPATPTSREDLLIASLRHANGVSVTLNQIDWALTQALGDQVDDPKFDRVFELLGRRFREDSALHLFIAADNLRIDLPRDLVEPEGMSEAES